MVGHGRPPIRIGLVMGLILLCAPLHLSFAASTDGVELRLRLQWGGGDVPRAWSVFVRATEGTISDAVGLGRNPDDPGSLHLTDSQLHVIPRSASSVSGVDLSLDAPRSAKVQVELRPVGESVAAQRFEVSVTDLISRSVSKTLEDGKTQFVIERAPGDRLRVALDRDALVVEPNEVLSLEVKPHLLGLDAEANLRCRVQVTRARSDDVLWSMENEIRVDRNGSALSPLPLSVTVPGDEGVFDIVLTVHKRRLADSISLVHPKPLATRKIQVVALNSRSQIDAFPRGQFGEAWKLLAEIDPVQSGSFVEPSNSRWPEWMKKMPTLKIPAFSKGPLAFGKIGHVEHLGRSLLQMEPNAWQTYPLPVMRLDEPHLLEIEYPNDERQTLGISFVEPDAAGRIVPVSGLDFGVDVPDSARVRESRLVRHKILFWPKTKTPLLLLTNRRERDAAKFGRIAIYSGPARLHALPSVNDGFEPRMIAISLDKPLFGKTLGGGDVLDPVNKESITDWVTFFEAGRRLAEYLKHHGYNTAVITVTCEGSALYPSQTLAPTLQYDSGMLSSSGQDPVRKDILEMLCRIFDREGLKIIPAIQFATPIPELEEKKLAGEQGLDWIGSDGKAWQDQFATNRGLAPYYNPLHPAVRDAMLRVGDELSERYGQHPCFAGVSLQLGPDTYAQLPNDQGSYDDLTVEQFEAATSIRVPGDGASRLAERVRYLEGEGREDWLLWRAEVLAEFYGKLAEGITAHSQHGKLYLATGDLLVGAAMQQVLRPRLSVSAGNDRLANVTDTLLGLGLDPRLLSGNSSVVLCRPFRSAPHVAIASQAANLEANRSVELDAWFSAGAPSAVQHVHETVDAPLHSFDAVSPFGSENTMMWLASQITPGGDLNRRRFARMLASLDALCVIDGGWTLPIGGEEYLQPWFEVFRRLPAEKFQTVAPQFAATAQPVVVRSLVRGNRVYLYAVNDSPWPVELEVELSGTAQAKCFSLNRSNAPLTLQQDGKLARWNATMEPYELRAIIVSSPTTRVINWRTKVSPLVLNELGLRLQNLMAQNHELRTPMPKVIIRNPGFELTDRQTIPGWEFKQSKDSTVQVDSEQAASESKSLQMKSSGEVVWVRSAPFAPPRSGRLAVGAKIRIARADKQPQLRIAVDDGRDYYPHVTLGAVGKPLSDQWTEYQLFIDNVPAVGVNELRVGFDLMGAGEVWIDDVQVFGLWLDKAEGVELAKRISQTEFLRNKPALDECLGFLESYWPELLEQYVPLPARLATRPAEALNAPSAEKDKPSNWRDKVNSILPKKFTR